MFLALRVLGAELFAVEIGKTPNPDDEKRLEAGPGGQITDFGFVYNESDVIVTKGNKSCR